MIQYQRLFLVCIFLTWQGNAQLPKFDLRSFLEQTNQDLNEDDLEFRQIAENGILEYRTSDSDDKVLQLRNGLEIRTLETSELKFAMEYLDSSSSLSILFATPTLHKLCT